ncbi:MAG: B12-binding domain-containing radical SAM protein [Deltaproteobacteria bacterium RBG_13_52_11]|nr:MAG: B12-binding domain-containing radical SAM protein [Deltaproteobacteria bacterium RBG_13_52_11]
MQILLISANRERMPYPVAPLGLAYIARALQTAGHDVRVIDLCFSSDLHGDVLQILEDFPPDVIGISLRNLDNLPSPSSLSYLPELEETVAVVRRRTSVPLVIGGSGFSLAPLPLMQRVDVDFGVVGEGEEGMVRIVECLKKGAPPHGIPGVLIKGKAEFIPPRPLEQFGAPDRDILDNAKYLKEGGMANLQTKRGCPFGCIYCTYPLLEGKSVRVRAVGEVVRELEALQTDQGADYIYFVDDIFNYPPDYTEALCREIIAHGVKMRWTAFVNPRFLTSEITALMAKAGCEGVELGIDSGSSKILRAYGKGFGVEDIVRASGHCREAGLNFALYLLLGGPGEDEGTLRETFDLMDRLAPTAVIVMVGIRIYPGTPLQEIAVREGVLKRDDALLEPRFYISPRIGPERLIELVTEAAMKRRGWIVPGLEINISPQLMEGIRKFGLRGPLWELASRMKRPRMHPLR